MTGPVDPDTPCTRKSVKPGASAGSMQSARDPAPAARAGLVRSFGAKPHAPPKPKTTLSPGITTPRAGSQSVRPLIVPRSPASVKGLAPGHHPGLVSGPQPAAIGLPPGNLGGRAAPEPGRGQRDIPA